MSALGIPLSDGDVRRPFEIHVVNRERRQVASRQKMLISAYCRKQALVHSTNYQPFTKRLGRPKPRRHDEAGSYVEEHACIVSA